LKSKEKGVQQGVEKVVKILFVQDLFFLQENGVTRIEMNDASYKGMLRMALWKPIYNYLYQKFI
jgi:hypothetical protein